MHILIAPNAFKNSLTASECANAIREGLKSSKIKATYECFPIADGGDGTAALIIDKCKGVRHNHNVQDPLGRKISAPFGLIDDGRTAVFEMADASGIRLLKEEELKKAERDIIIEVSEAYFTILKLESYGRIQKSNLERLEKQLNIAKEKKAVGNSGKADIFIFENEFSENESQNNSCDCTRHMRLPADSAPFFQL